MCTAPQNIYISKSGVETPDGIVSFEDVKAKISNAIKSLMENPKAAAPTLGAIQNDFTIRRIEDKISQHQAQTTSINVQVENAEFSTARMMVPSIISTTAADEKTYMEECFGPLIFIVETESYNQSLSLVKTSAQKHGAITCLAYTISDDKMKEIEEEMNRLLDIS